MNPYTHPHSPYPMSAKSVYGARIWKGLFFVAEGSYLKIADGAGGMDDWMGGRVIGG